MGTGPDRGPATGLGTDTDLSAHTAPGPEANANAGGVDPGQGVNTMLS